MHPATAAQVRALEAITVGAQYLDDCALACEHGQWASAAIEVLAVQGLLREVMDNVVQAQDVFREPAVFIEAVRQAWGVGGAPGRP